MKRLVPFLSLGGVVAGTPPEATLKSIRSPVFTPASILRVLRGEFSSTSGLASQQASVPCEPKLGVTTHSCLRQAGETTRNHFYGRMVKTQ